MGLYIGVILGEWKMKWKLLFRVEGLGFRDLGFRVLGLEGFRV